MESLFLVALLAVSYALVTTAVPLLNAVTGTCNILSVPTLETEAINPDNLEDFQNLSFNTEVNTNPGSSGTPGYNPGPALVAEYPPVRAWKASKAERLSLLYPSKTSLYYRDQVLNSSTYPWNTIGRVNFRRFTHDKGGWCTGTLVGSNLVLTASHCVPWGYGPGKWMRFIPGYANGTEPYGGSYVSRCRGVKNIFNVTGIDYVVCQLCEPLGNVTGWMKTAWWKDERQYTNRKWRSSGYPIDAFDGQTQMFLSDRRLVKVDSHGSLGVELETSVFATAGWSGGPMWDYIDGEPTIVGVCSGGARDCGEQAGRCYGTQDSSSYHDVSAGGRLMTDLVRFGIAHWN